MQIQGLEVVVVGGAVGGATAALLLAEAGAHVTLLERVATPRAVGAGIGLAANGLAVLSALGLRAALEQVGVEVAEPRIVDGHRRTLLRPEAGAPRVWMLRRSELHTLLLDALARHPRIRPCFGCEVATASCEGEVVARDEHGSTTRLRADLVIAADGVDSRVRAQGDFGARITRRGICYVRGLAGPGLACGEEAWTREGLFGSFAVSQGTYFYASVGGRALREALGSGDAAAFAASWRRAYPACAPIVEQLDMRTLLVNDVREVHCRRWSAGRCVLLGDAAHAMAPNLGQGANSALVDAAVLFEELAMRPSLEAALRAYEARRKPAVQAVAALSARLGRMAELTHPLLRPLRDALLPLAQRVLPAVSSERVLQEPVARLTALASAHTPRSA